MDFFVGLEYNESIYFVYLCYVGYISRAEKILYLLFVVDIHKKRSTKIYFEI